MLEKPWLENGLPAGTVEEGIARAKRLYWPITWGERSGRLVVWGGDKPMLITDSAEVVDAFLYGIGVAYGVLPDGIFTTMEAQIKELVDPDGLDDEDHHE